MSDRASAAEALESFRVEARTLTHRFVQGVDRRWTDEDFEARALAVFRHQVRWNGVYRRFCMGRGVAPDRVEAWQDIPPVPAAAFKALPLRSVPPEAVERVFRTSGTTGGSGSRGTHYVPSLDLYRASALPNLEARLLGDLPLDATGKPTARISILCLLPDPRRVPDSSLSTMLQFAVDRWGSADSGWFVDPEMGLRDGPLREAVARASAEGAPVLVAGTAFSFVHLLDAWREGGSPARLPDGSRIMETGGFKGRSREVDRRTLYQALQGLLGVPLHRIVNEYGMTELLSQFYEPVLRDGSGPDDPDDRYHVAPPWVRTQVLDPGTLEPVRGGQPGLLCHLDLANLGSVAHVLTEDLGVARDGGFEVLGRVRGAEPRGCSLAMEELMEAAGEGT